MYAYHPCWKTAAVNSTMGWKPVMSGQTKFINFLFGATQNVTEMPLPNKWFRSYVPDNSMWVSRPSLLEMTLSMVIGNKQIEMREQFQAMSVWVTTLVGGTMPVICSQPCFILPVSRDVLCDASFCLCNQFITFDLFAFLTSYPTAVLTRILFSVIFPSSRFSPSPLALWILTAQHIHWHYHYGLFTHLSAHDLMGSPMCKWSHGLWSIVF